MVFPKITTPTPAVKGKGFKISPPSPAERDIVDEVKRNMGISGRMRVDE